MLRLPPKSTRTDTLVPSTTLFRTRPLMRESIPYCVVMPKEKIALFTYTWVNKDSVAGAAFGVWGPGVGGEAITGYLPDRPVPRDMNFDAWQIEGFSMRQDRKSTRLNSSH